ncbi:MAG: hypothetical protein ACN4E6_13175 [Qipengyuania pacifica]
MAYAPEQLRQDPQYEAFLYAPLGEDHQGLSVTVLSMLARLGVDPWTEAADLSKLPRRAAQQRLEALIGKFRDVSTQVSDRGRIALKLLAFLPKPAKSTSSDSESAAPKLVIPLRKPWFPWVVAAALIFIWITMLAQGQ